MLRFATKKPDCRQSWAILLILHCNLNALPDGNLMKLTTWNHAELLTFRLSINSYLLKSSMYRSAYLTIFFTYSGFIGGHWERSSSAIALSMNKRSALFLLEKPLLIPINFNHFTFQLHKILSQDDLDWSEHFIFTVECIGEEEGLWGRFGTEGREYYGEGGKGMRSCGPATSQILGPPGIGFNLSQLKLDSKQL